MSSQWLRYIGGKLAKGVITFINMVSLANHDFPYHDYHEDTTTGAYQSYTVGANNKDGIGLQKKFFVSKATLLMCTEDVYVKFNHADNVVNTFLADTYYTIPFNVIRIMYADVDVAGTIYIWTAGVLPQEVRTPE